MTESLPPKKQSQGATLVFFVIALLMSAAMSFLFLGQPLIGIFKARQWSEAPCRILSSKVEEKSGKGNSKTYKVAISYAYSVEGQEYRSDRYSFITGSSSGRKGKAAVVDRYPPGSESICYFNPRHPAESVMNRHATAELWFGAIPVVFFLIVLGLFIRQRLPSKAPQWDNDVIVSDHLGGILAAWFLAVVFAGFAIVLIATVPVAQIKAFHPVGIAVIVFSVGAIALLARAVYLTAGYLKFGKSAFQAAELPLIGCGLQGAIHPSRPLTLCRAGQLFTLRLQNIHRYTTGTGKNRRQNENVLWQQSRRIESHDGTSIPVAFYIPEEAQETTTFDGGDGHLWRMEVESEGPGIDYHARFVIPVRRQELSAAHLRQAQELKQLAQQEVGAYTQPVNSRIRVEEAGGGTEFIFPAFRNLGVALAWFAFGAIFLSVGIGICRFASLPMGIIFSLVSLPILASGVSIAFKETRVIIGPDDIRILGHCLGINSATRVEKREIEKITTKISATHGSSALHAVELKLRNGKNITAGAHIPDLQEAQWLAARMGSLVGLQVA